MSIALKPTFRGSATLKKRLKLVVNVGELYNDTNSCGIARFPCNMARLSCLFVCLSSTLTSNLLWEIVLVEWKYYETIYYIISCKSQNINQSEDVWSAGPPFFRGKFCQIPRRHLRNSAKFRGTVIPKYLHSAASRRCCINWQHLEVL